MTRSSFSKRSNRLRQILAERRKTAGLTQGELAARLGLPQSYVSKYESGERRVDLVEVMEILEALEADVIGVVQELQSEGGSDGD